MLFLLSPLGLLGARIVFAHLLVLAILLTLLRSRMQESSLWIAALEEERSKYHAPRMSRLRQLAKPCYLRSMAFLVGMYGIWNLTSGTIGFFFPYILRTVGGRSQAAAMALQAGNGILAVASIILVFMRLVDRVDQRWLLGLSILAQIVALSLFAVFPLTAPIIIAYLIIDGLACFGAPQAFYQLWSAELFPTLVRGTAQGITFAIVRIALGVWSLFVPVLATSRFSVLIWTLVAFLGLGGFVGVTWAPRNEGKGLEQIETAG
jgi:inositol transporter-like SP family MFS transporter